MTAAPVATNGTDLVVQAAHPLILIPSASPPLLGSNSLDLSPLAAAIAKMQTLEAWMAQELIEREEATRIALAALLCGQHMVLVGPPGTAKSLLILLLAQALHLQKFVTLASPHTKPEDLFGPLALADLPKNIYRRLTTGYMPSAQVVFLDEAFNLNSAAAQTVLRLMNEREFDNGNVTEYAPLISIFGASNQLPQTPDSAAFYDRFLFRTWIDYVSRTNFPRLIGLYARRPSQAMLRVLIHNEPIFASQHGLVRLTPPPISFTPNELYTLMWAASHIVIPPSVVSALEKLYDDLDRLGIRISDRRWTQSLEALRAYALLDSSGIVTADHLSVYASMFWNTKEQRVGLARAVERLGNPLATKAVELGDQAQSAYNVCMTAQTQDGLDDGQRMQAAAEANGKLKRTGSDLAALREQATEQGMSLAKIDKVIARVETLRREVAALIL